MKNKLLVITGPTSTGKTDLALLVAGKINGEIISADSRQVYKYLDIGTGKKPASEMKIAKGDEFWILDGIKIHLYDVQNPEIRFNLHDYILKASEVISEITAKGKTPILVGGTGLYIRSLLEGVSDFRLIENRELRNELEELDIETILEKIKLKNPNVLKNLNNSEINNKRRLIRLLEKISSDTSGDKFEGIENKLEVLKIGLKVDREILDVKIRERVTKRINQGMVEESRELLDKKILSLKRMEELGLEYKYIAKYLKGEIKTQEELIDILSLRIRQYAKRQETWFKKEKDVVWFDISSPDYLQKVEYKVLNWYNITNE